MQTTRRGFVIGVAGAVVGSACREQNQTAAGAAPAKRAATDPAAGAPSAPVVTARGVIPKRRLGKTGVEVSLLGLGGFHIGQKLSDEESVTLMRRAVDEGVTFFDNCWDYNKGASEERMGKALADGYRERVFLMTKLDGRTQQAAREQLDQSLKRLRTDRIDLVQIHEVIRTSDPERCFAAGGVMDALLEARKVGKLRFIGFTGHKDPKMHLAMLAAAKKQGVSFDTVQMPLNVMDAHYRSFEREVLPVLVKEDIGVLGMKSAGGGHILKAGVVGPEECLRYAMSLPTSVVISGMDSLDVLLKNVKLAREFQPLSEEERKALLAKTAAVAKDGKHERFKTSDEFDGTAQNPHWLEQARL